MTEPTPLERTVTSQTEQRRLTAADFTTTYTINMQNLGEDGQHWVAYGHIETVTFLRDVRRHNGIESLGLDEADLYDPAMQDDVRQQWAVLVPDSPEDEWAITWDGITEETPGAFPITRLSFEL